MRKAGRFWPFLAISAFVLGLLAYGGVSYRVADGVTKLERKALQPPAEAVAAVHEDVTFRSADGLLLRGWWFPATALPGRAGGRGGDVAKADRAVVFVHGRAQNRVASSFRPDRIAPLFLARGWSVLLFDLRGHGESEGERYSLGQYEPYDIVAAVDLAAEKAGIPRSRVAVIGESLGAGSAIMTVRLDPTIGPIVTDSAYADGYTVVSEVGERYTGLPSWFTPGIALTSRLFFGLDVWSVRPADVVRAHPERAWLFIQCAEDRTVWPHHGVELKAASANPETELWMAPGCDHVKAFVTHPGDWEQRVTAFLDRQIAKAADATSR